MANSPHNHKCEHHVIITQVIFFILWGSWMSIAIHPIVVEIFQSVLDQRPTDWPTSQSCYPRCQAASVAKNECSHISLQRYDQCPALELNHFLFTGPASCCPSSHVQGFEGNSVSITKHGQPTQTHEERLGHPPNQCPRELTRPIPAGACPGNVTHPSTHTHSQLERKCFLPDMTTL